MSRRFSGLFVLPRSYTSTPHPDESHNTSIPKIESRRKRDSLKTFASSLFSRDRQSRTSPSPDTKPKTKRKISRRQSHIPSSTPSLHDSGIGSESSSIASLTLSPQHATTISLSIRQGLLASLGTLETLLETQDTLSQSLSKNILYLMAIKEFQIKANKRLQPEWKTLLSKEMNVLRSSLRDIFTKKFTSTHQSLIVVHRLQHGLEKARRLEESFVAGLEKVKEGIESVRGDTVYQDFLSEGIIDRLTLKCWKARWVQSQSQRVEMRRFVGFVVERVGRLHAVSREVEEVVKDMRRVC